MLSFYFVLTCWYFVITIYHAIPQTYRKLWHNSTWKDKVKQASLWLCRFIGIHVDTVSVKRIKHKIWVWRVFWIKHKICLYKFFFKILILITCVCFSCGSWCGSWVMWTLILLWEIQWSRFRQYQDLYEYLFLEHYCLIKLVCNASFML